MSHAAQRLTMSHRCTYNGESCFVENLLPPDGGGLALVREMYICERLRRTRKTAGQEVSGIHVHIIYSACGSTRSTPDKSTDRTIKYKTRGHRPANAP